MKFHLLERNSVVIYPELGYDVVSKQSIQLPCSIGFGSRDSKQKDMNTP